jgi:hypothetical protein
VLPVFPVLPVMPRGPGGPAQALSASARHEPASRAVLPAAFFEKTVTGNGLRLFFFTAAAPLVNAISNEFIAEIFSLPLLATNARTQLVLQTAGQLVREIKKCWTTGSYAAENRKREGAAAMLASICSRKPRHIEGQGRKKLCGV